jgi:hypothetical protein
MKVAWYAPAADGRPGFSGNQLITPGRYNFLQAAIYRLKLSNIPNRPGLELYPTLEVVPGNARTDTFLAHSAVPVAFTDEDFDQVAANNYVIKVIYLPAPQFQDLATTGPDEVVSTRLEPGVDPIAEACRRGNILLVVRLGNVDLEAPNTPPMDAPNPYANHAAVAAGAAPHGMPPLPGMMGPSPMVPYGANGKPLVMPSGPIAMPTGMMMPGQPGALPAPAAPPAKNSAAAPAATPVTRLPDTTPYPQFDNPTFHAAGMPPTVWPARSDAR